MMMVLFNAIKKEKVSMLIFICERCGANATDFKAIKNYISDIKKVFSKCVMVL